MSLLAPLASGLMSRRVANRMARMIPNPVLRYAALLAATTVVPYLAAKAAQRWNGKSQAERSPYSKSR